MLKRNKSEIKKFQREALIVFFTWSIVTLFGAYFWVREQILWTGIFLIWSGLNLLLLSKFVARLSSLVTDKERKKKWPNAASTFIIMTLKLCWFGVLGWLLLHSPPTASYSKISGLALNIIVPLVGGLRSNQASLKKS